MTNKSGNHEDRTDLSGRIVRFALGIPVALFSILLVSGCSSSGGQVTEQQGAKELDEQQLPINFNPPFEMTFSTAQQKLENRGQVLTTDINYVAVANSSNAHFFVQDIQDPDQVFVDQSGEGDSLSATVKRTYSGDDMSLGESSASRQLEYQQYLVDNSRACVMVVKYSGDDGAGDISRGGEPRGSVSIFADICEEGTEQLSAQRRQQWIDSFQYRQK